MAANPIDVALQVASILGIILVQSEALDRRYLRHAADILAVTDLLERALHSSGTS